MSRIRENRFVIMLSEKERQAIEALARVEKLPASTLARRRLLLEVEQRGIFSIGTNDKSAVDSLQTRHRAFVA